jgi:zinc transport system substrate-binding protein
VMKSKADQLNVSQFKVIASFHQASFVEWLGFDIITTYPSPETISTKQFLELLLIGKREKVDLIVDNLQSGTDFGAKLASDLNSTQAILTNFPGLIPQTESLAEMLSYNAEQLFNTIEVK